MKEREREDLLFTLNCKIPEKKNYKKSVVLGKKWEKGMMKKVKKKWYRVSESERWIERKEPNWAREKWWI